MEEGGQKELQLLPSQHSSCSYSQMRSRPPDFSSLSDGNKADTSCVEAMKWQAAEQIRLATIEKAYAERVRELTRKEIELAQSEFARARHMWQRAREEVEKAERMKERATRQIDSTCMEITCQSCRQRFKP
ncbi:zinc finger protein SHOOT GRAVITROPISM 5 isoform X2 [Hevea brasiliensis]|uniref:zinc finger protein SHOOT GRAVITROPISM 5 isoform X2 n=1 Tax=Hevea brasiliensis TaxID=3981 RepID=UPI0025DE904D|nr:zinc finger protein SHOOT GRAVITROPISM 5 isoform X2 [Hevea brasiliensis]